MESVLTQLRSDYVRWWSKLEIGKVDDDHTNTFLKSKVVHGLCRSISGVAFEPTGKGREELGMTTTTVSALLGEG
jgi:hypothetical protein